MFLIKKGFISAKTGEGVDDAFSTLVEMIIEDKVKHGKLINIQKKIKQKQNCIIM